MLYIAILKISKLCYFSRNEAHQNNTSIKATTQLLKKLYFILYNISHRFRTRCVMLSTELTLDGSQPIFTLHKLGLCQAVSVLRAQGITQLFQGLKVLSCLCKICCNASLLNSK